MADRTPVDYAVDDYAASTYSEGYEEGKASRQPEIDALALANTRAWAEGVELGKASRQPEVDALMLAYTSWMDHHHRPDDPYVTEYVDFAQRNSGRHLGNQPLSGAGADYNVIQIKEGTATKPIMPTYKPDGTKNTTPYRVLRFGEDSAAKAVSGLRYEGFTVRSTAQPVTRYYGGIQLGYSLGTVLDGITVLGMPGYAPGPPGETAGIELWNSTSPNLRNIKIDGLGGGATDAGASLLMGTTTRGDVLVDGFTARNAVYGFAVAFFRCQGTQTISNFDISNSRSAFNIEDSAADEVNLNGGRITGITSRHVIQVSSKTPTTTHSTRVNIRDVTVDVEPMQVRWYPNQPGGVQKAADIRRFEGGVDITGDPARFQLVTG